ncbi:MAG: ATP-binding cassette domain-containing protein [Chloroflexota bacterium]
MALDGHPVAFASPADAIDRGIGLVAEDRKQQSLVLERSVTENATLASLGTFVNRIRIVDQRAEQRAVRTVVDELGIRTPTIDTLVTNLSGGNQQKVVIGRFLLTQIVLFLMDEPTRGIDVGAKAEIYALMGRLAAQGTGFLLVSSEMPELLAVCDRIHVLCEGRITAEFARDAFDQEAIVEAATRFADKAAAADAA